MQNVLRWRTKHHKIYFIMKTHEKRHQKALQANNVPYRVFLLLICYKTLLNKSQIGNSTRRFMSGRGHALRSMTSKGMSCRASLAVTKFRSKVRMRRWLIASSCTKSGKTLVVKSTNWVHCLVCVMWHWPVPCAAPVWRKRKSPHAVSRCTAWRTSASPRSAV